MTLDRKKALSIALREVGVKEHPAGSNRGRRVEEYQRADGLKSPDIGYAWCASFVNWCYVQAGRPLKELDRSASVGNLLAAARKLGWAHTGTPKPGDLVCFDWGSLTGPGKGDWPDHIGIVKSVGSGGAFVAVEGNTAVGNDSNGGQVMTRYRNRSMVEAFIRVPGGYKVQKRWRIVVWKGDKIERKLDGLWLAGVLRRLPGIVKALKYGQRVVVRPYRNRVEKPKA